MSDPHAAATTPADDEPKTPMWLPVLGLALFLVFGLAWALRSVAPGPSAKETAASASASASSTAHAAPSASAVNKR